MAEIRRILVPTDIFPGDHRVAEWAADLARRYDAELLVVRVLDPVKAAAQSPMESARAEANLDELASKLAGDRGRARLTMEPDIAQAIRAIADEELPDLIVLANPAIDGAAAEALVRQLTKEAHCDVIAVNPVKTPFVVGEERAHEERKPSRRHMAQRAARISEVMLKHGIRELTGNRSTRTANEQARNFREALEELGPTFSKLGQLLSTRADLLPPEFIEELAKLQENVPPLSEPQVLQLIEAEFKVRWDRVFEHIESEPIAAGTIAQVHRATLRSGDPVVVKVQRPGAATEIAEDLALLEVFARRAGSQRSLRQIIDLPTITANLAASLHRELDFREEARNMERMEQILRPFPLLAIPKVYKQYSTSRVLVMEEVRGIPLHEAPEGPIRSEAARQLLESYYTQVIRDGFFHADPHPGNVKWANDRIYLLDLGMVGEVDPELRELLLMLLLAFWQRDASFLSEVVLMLGEDQIDWDATQRHVLDEEMAQLIARYRDTPLGKISIGPLIQEIVRIAARRHIRINPALPLIGKALSQMQLAASELDPTIDPLSVVGSFLMRTTMKQVAGGLSPRRLFYDAEKTWVRLDRFIQSIEGAVGARPGHGIKFYVRGTERVEASIDQASRRLALALGVTSAVVAASATTVSPRINLRIPMIIGAVAAALSAVLTADILKRRPG